MNQLQFAILEDWNNKRKDPNWVAQNGAIQQIQQMMANGYGADPSSYKPTIAQRVAEHVKDVWQKTVVDPNKETIDKVKAFFGDPDNPSSSASKMSEAANGSYYSAEQVANNPSGIDIANAPITSAVSGITDLTDRANAYNEMMVNSAHQREVADLIAAGLNPVLSAKHGGSASPDFAAYSSGSSGGSGTGSAENSFFGIKMPMLRNPRTSQQLLYNLAAANASSAEGVIRAIFGK